MSTALLVRRAALVICFCLCLGLASRTASADDRYCDAKYISSDQFFKELKAVKVAVKVDPWVAKIVPEDDLRKRVADALAPYDIAVRDQAPVTLFVEVDDSPGDIKRTTIYSNGSRTEEVYHCHTVYCEMAFFVRATALRKGKFHLLAASAMYSSNIFTVQEAAGVGKLIFGDAFTAELKQKLQLNLADRMKFFATPGPAAAPDPWPVEGWSDQQKGSVNDQPLPAMEATSVSQPKDITKHVALGMDFVRIEPGMFVMGSPEGEVGRGKSETQHAVKLTKPFYMATKDVMRAQFAIFVADTNFKTDAEKANDENTWQHNKVFEQEETCPVVNVSWSDAQAFINWLSKRDHKTYRLPTEAEWEYACRAGTTTTFNTGDTISSDQANYDGTAVYGAGVKGERRWKTMPVGSFPANKWGLYDMHGNVWQWCSDVFADYPNETVTNPTGPKPDPKASHVLRGGSWGIDPIFLRSASRLDGAPGSRGGYNVGFRVVSDAP